MHLSTCITASLPPHPLNPVTPTIEVLVLQYPLPSASHSPVHAPLPRREVTTSCSIHLFHTVLAALVEFYFHVYSDFMFNIDMHVIVSGTCVFRTSLEDYLLRLRSFYICQ